MILDMFIAARWRDGGGGESTGQECGVEGRGLLVSTVFAPCSQVGKGVGLGLGAGARENEGGGRVWGEVPRGESSGERRGRRTCGRSAGRHYITVLLAKWIRTAAKPRICFGFVRSSITNAGKPRTYIQNKCCHGLFTFIHFYSIYTALHTSPSRCPVACSRLYRFNRALCRP